MVKTIRRGNLEHILKNSSTAEITGALTTLFGRPFGGILAIAADGSFELATACTWRTIWDEALIRDYRVHCSTGKIEVEVDGAIKDTLSAGNSRDFRGKKIKVHATENNSTGTFGRP